MKFTPARDDTDSASEGGLRSPSTNETREQLSRQTLEPQGLRNGDPEAQGLGPSLRSSHHLGNVLPAFACPGSLSQGP